MYQLIFHCCPGFELLQSSFLGNYDYTHLCFHFSVDATEENETCGRLMNHSKLGNIKPRVIDDGNLHLCFFACEDIDVGEELLYDYGERKKDIVEQNEWLRQ